MALPAPGNYDPGFYSDLFAAEDDHFWFRSRNRVIAELALQAVAGLKPGYRVLDLGCGTGNVMHSLQTSCSGGTVIGMDQFGEGLHFARLRGVSRLVRGDLAQAPFSKKFHVIGMFDVLEHIPDDKAALAQVFGLLESGGALLITVPAHRKLWSYFDEAAHHCRRYEAAELRARLREAGFVVEYLSQYMMPLLPLMWLRRLFVSRAPGDKADAARSELHVNRIVNRALTFLLSCEPALVAKRIALPAGTSLVALARK